MKKDEILVFLDKIFWEANEIQGLQQKPIPINANFEEIYHMRLNQTSYIAAHIKQYLDNIKKIIALG